MNKLLVITMTDNTVERFFPVKWWLGENIQIRTVDSDNPKLPKTVFIPMRLVKKIEEITKP
jgi:hypothetical protein